MSASLGFPGLPLWQGVRADATPPDILPFDLDLDPAGFVRQASSPEIRKRMAEIYARDDYAFITPPPGASAWANALGERKLAALLAACPRLDGLDVLEIGAGSLFVAEALRRRFAINSYVAVDPALPPVAADGIEVLPSFFPCDALAGRKFDLIIGFSCLEHVPDPVAFLRDCRAALKPGALGVFLTFPDCTRAFAQGDLSILVHEHLSYFDRAGAERALAAAGLAMAASHSDNDLFRCLARPATDAAPMSPVPDLDAVVNALRHTAATLGEKIRAQLDQGLRLAFHGANPNIYNLLWLSDLAGDPRVRIFDQDASKWGRYLPTCANPIVAADGPDYLGADAIYVAATSFLAEIRQSLAQRGVDPARVHPLLAEGIAP